MPFEGLSLLDYAINTCLVVSNIVLRKYDRIGLITFSDKLGTALRADRKANQLNLILNALYNEKQRILEANFELAYQATRNIISGRSLILFYTNFESMYALERSLPLLRKINQQHLLVVIFFKNTEIEAFAQRDATNVAEIYEQTIAQKLLVEKQQMVHKLRQYGIQAVLTAPEDLSLNTVNKYLELCLAFNKRAHFLYDLDSLFGGNLPASISQRWLARLVSPKRRPMASTRMF